MKIKKRDKSKKCKQCGCIMEYESNDIKNKVVDIRTSDFFKTYEKWSIDYINCPQCNNEIEVGQKCLT